MYKTVLLVIGLVLLVLGIPLVVVASRYISWEQREYKQLMKKDAPSNLKNATLGVGIALIVLGLGLAVWGSMMHAGVGVPVAKLSFKDY